jgi:hypothetical protein
MKANRWIEICCLVLSLCVIYSHATVTIPSLNTTFSCVPVHYKDSSQVFSTIQGLLVTDESENMTGYIVITRGASMGRARTLQAAGAIAIVFSSDGVVPGQAQFNIDDRDFENIYVPICQSLLRYTTPVLDQLEPDQPVEAVFDPSEINEWDKLSKEGYVIFLQVSCSAFILTNLGLAFYRVGLFIKYVGCTIGLAQICLAAEIIANSST